MLDRTNVRPNRRDSRDNNKKHTRRSPFNDMEDFDDFDDYILGRKEKEPRKPKIENPIHVEKIEGGKFINVIDVEYTFLKIIPTNNLDLCDTKNIVQTIHSLHGFINKRIYFSKDKFSINIRRDNLKISYFIDITLNKVNFYFIIPKETEQIFKSKIRSVWKDCTVKEVKSIPNFTEKSIKYKLSYRNEDALSLNTTSTQTLSNILSVLDIIEDNDRVGVMYNFKPMLNLDWYNVWNKTINKYRNYEDVSLDKINSKKIFFKSIKFIIHLLESFINALMNFGDLIPNKEVAIMDKLTEMFYGDKRDISSDTKKKKEGKLLSSQIVIIGDGKNIDKVNNNVVSVCNSYNSLTGDNQMKFVKVNTDFNFTNGIFSNCEWNNMSLEECSKLIELPIKKDVLSHPMAIEHKDIFETDVPLEGKIGFKRCGVCEYNGVKTIAHLSSHKEISNLPLVVMGEQGGGKSTFIVNYILDCISKDESVVVIDFIDVCQLSQTIKKYVPKEKIIDIDLSKRECRQGFGYNEIGYNENDDVYERIRKANSSSLLIEQLINSVNIDEELSVSMSKYLISACNVMYTKDIYASLGDVSNILEYPTIRKDILESLNKEEKYILRDDIMTLNSLDEIKYDKKLDELTVIGNKDSKINSIMTRLNVLKKEMALKSMYDKTSENNINFKEEINKGKVILIQMPEGTFLTESANNILTTFFTTKTWLSMQLRSAEKSNKKDDKELIKCNFIVDELAFAPTSLQYFKKIIPQSRKKRFKPVLTCHGLNQISPLEDCLKNSGTSYMLLKGTDKSNFEKLKDKLEPFSITDLAKLKQYQSLNIINYSTGYAKFITTLDDLPKKE